MRSTSSWSVRVWARPSGMSETSLVRRSSIEPVGIATRSPAAVLSTSRSAVSSTGKPVMTRPSASATTTERKL